MLNIRVSSQFLYGLHSLKRACEEHSKEPGLYSLEKTLKGNEYWFEASDLLGMALYQVFFCFFFLNHCYHKHSAQERICCLAFSGFQRLSYSLTQGPFLHPQSQQWWVQTLSHHLTLKLTLLSPSSILKDPCDYVGPICIIQMNLPILRSADQHP